MRTLMAETLKKLKEDSRSIEKISRFADVPFYWLRKFAAGEFKDPSVNRVQKLYEFLTDKKLDC